MSEAVLRIERSAEPTLSRSEARFRDVAEMVSDWIWETGPDLRLTFLTVGGLRALSTDCGSPIGKSWGELPLTPVYLDESVEHLEQMNKRRPFRNAMVRIALPTGDDQYLRLSGKPIFDETGFSGYRGAGTDVTAEMTARNEARLLRDRLHDAVESLYESFSLYDADDRLLLANQRRHDLHPAIPNPVTPGMRFEETVVALAAQGFYARPPASPDDCAVGYLESDERMDAGAHARALAAGLPEHQARIVGRRLWLHLQAPCEHVMRLSTGQWILVREQRTREGGWVITHSDITDTIERTHQLEQKTAFLQMTLDTVNAGIRVVDKDWNLVAWNQQYVRMFDYPERLMHAGMPLMEILRASAKEGLLGDGDPDELAEQEVDKARRRAKGIPTEYFYNGRRFDAVRLALPDGSDFCAFTDVTETFERQRQLQEKSTLLQTVFDTINEGIWVCDRDWRLLYWNHRYARMRSYPKEMMRVGTPLIDLFRYSARRSAATAADADRIAEARLREIASRRSGQTYRYEAADGRMLETRVFTMPNGDHLATVTDISETVNHQRQLAGKTSLLQMTLDSINQGLRVYDRDWRLVVYNRHYADLTGFSSELMQVGARLIDLLRDAANRGILGPGDPEALAQGQFDFVRNAPGGEPVQVRLTDGMVLEVLTVRMPDGTNFGTVTDITDRLRAEADRERLEGQLRHKLKMEAIGTLAGGIAHDFNNILSAIIGYSEMALNCLPKGARPERHVREILAAGTRAKALTAQILEFSRQREGERKPVRVVPILADTLQLIRASVPSTVELRRVMSDPSLAVLADSTQIHQVIMNLCTNAWQAMPQGGVLELGLDRVDAETDLVLAKSTLPPGRYARIWVTDNGHGIDPAAMDRIFDPFFTTKSVNGTGLGLSVAYGIVTRHGGGIDVQSTPDHGTRFDVYLPVCDEPSEDADEVQTVPRGRGQVILLVDDEESLVALGEELLAELGYEPVGYGSGAAALQAFRDNPHRFDLVMLDQMMPRMTGTEIAEQVSRIRADIPIVLMTGYDDPALDGHVAAGKIRRLLLKPLSIHEIGTCLARILDGA